MGSEPLLPPRGGVGVSGSQQDEGDSVGRGRFRQVPSVPQGSPDGSIICPQPLHGAPGPDSNPLPFSFPPSSRLVRSRAAAEIQGDREDICQHRVQVLQLQRPPTVSTPLAARRPCSGSRPVPVASVQMSSGRLTSKRVTTGPGQGSSPGFGCGGALFLRSLRI